MLAIFLDLLCRHILGDPSVILEDFKAGSLIRCALQTRVNEVLEISTDSFREAVIELTNPLVSLSVTTCFKRRLAHDKLIGKDTQRPYVNRLVVIVLLSIFLAKHFRRQVVQSATHCLPSIRRSMHRPTEVS